MMCLHVENELQAAFAELVKYKPLCTNSPTPGGRQGKLDTRAFISASATYGKADALPSFLSSVMLKPNVSKKYCSALC